MKYRFFGGSAHGEMIEVHKDANIYLVMRKANPVFSIDSVRPVQHQGSWTERYVRATRPNDEIVFVLLTD